MTNKLGPMTTRVFRLIMLENLILKFELKGKARTHPEIFRVVLGPCAQFCLCEASEQKWGQKPRALKL